METPIMVPGFPLGTWWVRIALSSHGTVGCMLHPTVGAVPPHLLCKGHGGPWGHYLFRLAWRSPGDILIMLEVAPLETPRGSSGL